MLFQLRKGTQQKEIWNASDSSGQIIATSHDLTLRWWFSKGNPLISGKSRLVKYCNLARFFLSPLPLCHLPTACYLSWPLGNSIELGSKPTERFSPIVDFMLFLCKSRSCSRKGLGACCTKFPVFFLTKTSIEI